MHHYYLDRKQAHRTPHLKKESRNFQSGSTINHYPPFSTYRAPPPHRKPFIIIHLLPAKKAPAFSSYRHPLLLSLPCYLRISFPPPDYYSFPLRFSLSTCSSTTPLSLSLSCSRTHTALYTGLVVSPTLARALLARVASGGCTLINGNLDSPSGGGGSGTYALFRLVFVFQRARVCE